MCYACVCMCVCRVHYIFVYTCICNIHVLHMCVCVCVYVGCIIYSCTHIWKNWFGYMSPYVHVCEGLMLISGIFLGHLSSLLLTQGLLLSPELDILSSLASQPAPRFTTLSLLLIFLKYRLTAIPTLIFLGVGDPNSSFIHAHTAMFYLLSHHPSTISNIIKNLCIFNFPICF